MLGESPFMYFVLSSVFRLNQLDEERLHKLAEFVLLYGRYFPSAQLSAAAPQSNLFFIITTC